MLEDILGAVLRHQVGDIRRRTTGAVLEAVGLGLIGLATVFLTIGIYLFLAARLEPWLAALIVAVLVALAALVVMLIGRSMLARGERERSRSLGDTLGGVGLMGKPSARGARREGPAEESEDPRLSLVAAALTAGVVLGRSLRR